MLSTMEVKHTSLVDSLRVQCYSKRCVSIIASIQQRFKHHTCNCRNELPGSRQSASPKKQLISGSFSCCSASLTRAYQNWKRRLCGESERYDVFKSWSVCCFWSGREVCSRQDEINQKSKARGLPEHPLPREADIHHRELLHGLHRTTTYAEAALHKKGELSRKQ